MHTRAHTRTRTQTNAAAVLPTCFVTEQTSPPITITGPDLHHKRQEGPHPAAPVFLSETHRGVRETGRRVKILAVTPNTDRRARSCGQRSAAARPKDSRSSVRFQSPSSPGLNRAAPSLAVGRPDPLCGKTKDVTD